MNDKMKKDNNLKNYIYNELLKSIIEGEYQPEDVISEKDLVEKFHVSKSPVREALIELCNEGVLRSIPRYGYEVIRLTESDVEDMRKFRIILECGCLDKYWDMITPAQIECLQKVYSDNYQENLEYSVTTHWQNNMNFHLTLISFFNNQYIYQALNACMKTLLRAYSQFYWDKWHLKQNDKANAIKCLEKDITAFK